jgi:uncharacterized RDD family membrane protein YckC
MIKKRIRLFNWLLDTFVCLVFFIVFIKLSFQGKPSDNTLRALKYYFLLLNAFYYLLLELIFKTTIGKIITRTKIVGENNEEIKLKNILIRTLARFIPFEGISVLFNDDNLILHDTLSKTKITKINNLN